jgi:hypothetical protein
MNGFSTEVSEETDLGQLIKGPPELPRHVTEIEEPLWLYVALLTAAIATAIAFTSLLGRAPGIGLNLFFVLTVFFCGWFLIARHRSVAAWRKLAAIAALTYAGAVALRASGILQSVNLLLMVGFAVLACTPLSGRAIYSVWACITGAMDVVINAALGSVLFASQTPWRRLQLRNHRAHAATRILMGAMAAVPFLVVFGLLFSRAELSFGRFFQQIYNTVLLAIFENLRTVLLSFLVSLGLLRCAFLVQPTDVGREALSGRFFKQIGFVESVTVLSLLIAMFSLFVATQLPYLFGGQQAVSATPDLAWSEYARRGFFELAWVVTLLIPTLMLFFNCTLVATSLQRITLLTLCGFLSVLTCVIIASALQRMLLYTRNFGLTELRIYVSTCIVMFGLLLAFLNAFAATGRAHMFLPAALITGFVFSLGIQFPNVQALVARDIIHREQSGKKGDLEYLGSLSADSIPVILESNLPKAKRVAIANKILASATTLERSGQLNWVWQPLGVLRGVHAMEAFDRSDPGIK